MSMALIINISVAVIVIVGILVAYYARKRPAKKKPERLPNYEAFFVMGISFLPLGFIFTAAIGNPGFLGLSGLGIIYIAIGLSNMNKGKDSEVRKKHMTYAEDRGNSETLKLPDRLKASEIMKGKNKPIKRKKARKK
jgi:hypothetical protein